MNRLREADQAKVVIKAARKRESADAKAKINTLQSQVRAFKKNRQSVQQHRHEANRARMEAEVAYAEVRKLEKEKQRLMKVAETLAQRYHCIPLSFIIYICFVTRM